MSLAVGAALASHHHNLMDDILRQLGELALNAVPTIVLFLLLWTVYYFVVHRALVRTLAERHARTVGAIEQARADVAAADARTSEYEHLLRDAKLNIYKYLEGRRQKALEAREAALVEARKAADEQVRSAKASIEQDASEARSRLQAEAESLAAAVLRTILKAAGPAASPAAGGRA